MSEKKRAEAPQIPAFRFSGFSGEWEEKKLGDLADITTGKLDANAMKEDGKYDFYTSGIQKYKIDVPAFKGPAITIAGNGATVGYMHYADDEFNAYQRTYVLTNFKALREYLFVAIGQNLPRKIHAEARTGNIPYIVIGMLTDLEIPLPSPEEQTQIGDFFQKIDQVIELQQKALDTARAYKQSMLQKMFPQKGEKVPRVRFAGFSGDWEDYALHKITNRLDNLRKPVTASERVLGTTPYYGANGIQDYVQGYTHEGEHILVAEDGANNLRDYPIQYVEGKIWVNNHAHVLAAKASCDIKFLSYALKRINFIPFLVGGGRAKLNAHIMMQIKVRIPKIEEQTAIGNFFQKLDQQIEQQAQKLATYQQLKKAMLQRMFV